MNSLKKFSTTALTLSATLLMALPATSFAQQSHGIAAVINDDIVTNHDLAQRVLFMMATTGAERNEATLRRIQQQALRNLIDEHLQMQESEKFDQSIGDEEVNRNVARLFARNGLEPEDVIGRLAQAGVSIETLRDQVRSEIAWQRIVNGLFGSRIRISDDQIDETLDRLSSNASEPSFRVAEIYIEATPDIGGMEGAMEGAHAMIAQANQGAPFPLLAQQFSSAPTAAKGGDLGWVHEDELRPELSRALSALDAGGVSDPIQVPGGVYVITLLDKQQNEADTVYKLKQVSMEVADKSKMEAAMENFSNLIANIDSCESLSSDVSEIEGLGSADMGEIKASDMAEQMLAVVNETEIGSLSKPVEAPQGPVAIMVCDKSLSGKNIPTRGQIEDRLTDQQLAQASKRHLRDMRRQATIVLR